MSVMAASAATLCHAADAPYHFIKEIPIPGKAQWDYLRVDPDAHRLYVTHGTKVEVIDLDKGAVIGAIEDTPGVHGIAFAPKLVRAFTSNGQENKASIVDLKTLKTLSKVSRGANPDSILDEATQHAVYTFNGKGKSATVFDPAHPIRFQFQWRGWEHHHCQGIQSKQTYRRPGPEDGGRCPHHDLNPLTHEIYLPAPTPSFRVLVYGMEKP
ncbi:MAG: hypothetical protein U1G07_17215 [Verrucomicrobiota bacterium]